MNKYTKTPPDHTSADGRIRFYRGDCMSVMKAAKDGEWDLAVVDPPYGLEWAGTGFKKKNIQERNLTKVKEWESTPPDQIYFNELRRVSKDQIIWGGNYFLDYLGFCKTPLIWDKGTGDNTFADGELAWTSFKTGTLRIFRHQWCGAFKDSERGIKAQHPTQKPIELYRWCLHRFASKGMKILDTHGGSMSSAIAADMEGYEMDIVELDGDYFKAGWNRFSDYYTNKTEIAELGYARTAISKINPVLF